MKANYLTPNANLQTAELLPTRPLLAVRQFRTGSAFSARSLRAPRPLPARERAWRRAVRTAEMAAWEAFPPKPAAAMAEKPARLPRPEKSRREAVALLLVGLCALAAVTLGLVEVGNLLRHWPQFVDGIRHFLP
jgi:hypothetical protein